MCAYNCLIFSGRPLKMDPSLSWVHNRASVIDYFSDTVRSFSQHLHVVLSSGARGTHVQRSRLFHR